MALDFLSLPPELKVQISEWLNYQDHYWLASACQQNWTLFQDAVRINRLRSVYKHLIVKSSNFGTSEPSNVEQILGHIILQPHFKTYTKLLSFHDDPPRFSDHRQPKVFKGDLSGFRTPPSDTIREERELLLQEHYLQSLLQNVCPLNIHEDNDAGYMEDHLSMALTISLPYLEQLAFEGDSIMKVLGPLIMHYHQTPELHPGIFQHLTHVQLASSFLIKFPYMLVHQFAQLSSMKRIEAIEIYANTSMAENCKQGKSNVQELCIVRADLVDVWLRFCLPMYHKLQRFACIFVHEAVDSCSLRATIKALLHHTSKTLLSMHLKASSFDREGSRVLYPDNHPYLSLKDFQNLQILRCEWDSIVPEEEFESEIESDDGFPVTSGRLIDILPESLVVLQLNYAKDKINADKRLIEYLHSKPSNLRRIDWNDPSQALRNAAEIANVELHHVVEFKGWSCAIGCTCDNKPEQKFGISMPPEMPATLSVDQLYWQYDLYLP